MKKTVVVGSTVGAAFIAAGIVFSMLLVGRIRANDECRVSLAEVASTRSAVEKFIDSKAEDVKLTDEELKVWTDFEEAYSKANDSYNKARNYDLMRSERDKTDEEWKKFHHSKRTIESCKEEFNALKNFYKKEKENIRNIYTSALIGEEDKIFNVKAQKEFYGKKLNIIKNARHNLFFKIEKYEEIFDL